MQFSISNTKLDEEILSKDEEEIIPYFEDYDDRKMWMSYWYQIKKVLDTGGENVLVVGVGNKTVTNYLKTISKYTQNLEEVTTADIDENLNPDQICDVLELSKQFNNKKYDTVLCAEVLEHLPFKKFEKALEELKKVSKEWVIISLPYAGKSIKFSLELPNEIRKDIKIKMDSNEIHHCNGWHRWEVGKKKYSLEKIKEKISKKFKIEEIFSPPENQYHLFFILKKKN